MKLHENQLNLIRHLIRFNILSYEDCLSFLDTENSGDMIAMSYAFRPLTKNGYVVKNRDGVVAVLQKGRELFPDEFPLISAATHGKSRLRVMQVSKVCMWMEKVGVPVSGERLDTEEPYFIPSARWRDIAKGILSTTRFVGMLMAYDKKYAVYDIGDGTMEWQLRAESSLFYYRYGSFETKADGMIMICDDGKRNEIAKQIIRQTMWARKALLKDCYAETNSPGDCSPGYISSVHPTGGCIAPTMQTLKVAPFSAIMMLPTLEPNYGSMVMNIGNQIKALRLRRGVTQEALAQHFGITSQAVSKWECGSSVPDIGMLPGLSTYFGVSIDELFELSDEQRMERIQNMLYDVRFTNPADIENERRFLLEKARREPSNNEVYEMLANLELHVAGEHNERAEEYALQAMACAPLSARAFTALAHAMGGKHVDPRNNAHNALISHYKLHLAEHPEAVHCYAWLIAQLIDDKRLDEAKYFCNIMAQYDSSYYVTIHLIKIALAENHIETARVMWEQLGKDYPKNWSVWHWIGDFQAQIGDYAAAKESYKISFDLMDAPHYTDPLDSLAKVCEMAGDIEGAIATRKYELEISEKEWGDTTGESVDSIHREIARLEKLL